MELKHSKINILGDSISAGLGASSVENGYVGRLIQKYPDAVIRNYSVSGSCISNNRLWGLESFCTRADEMYPDAELVIVFGGSNDYCCCTPLGTPEDRTEDTFYGACYVLFEKLLRKFHGKVIAVMTPLHRLDEDGNICEGRQMIAPLYEYVRVLKERAAWFGFPVIDLFATSGMQPNFDFIREIYFPDGLHPNDTGHEVLFRRVDAALRQL